MHKATQKSFSIWGFRPPDHTGALHLRAAVDFRSLTFNLYLGPHLTNSAAVLSGHRFAVQNVTVCVGHHYCRTEMCAGRIACCSSTACWLRGTVVERRSVTGELSLSYARPAADG